MFARMDPRPKKVVVCTIYYPDEARPAGGSWADAALCAMCYDRNPGKLQTVIRKTHEVATSRISGASHPRLSRRFPPTDRVGAARAVPRSRTSPGACVSPPIAPRFRSRNTATPAFQTSTDAPLNSTPTSL
eukprot:30972-Pelagococcus_subviridis.AAC.2